jgi:hypothetical protein
MTRLIRELGRRKVPVGIVTLAAAVAVPTLVISNPTCEFRGDNAFLEQFARSGPLPSHIDWNSSSGRVSVSAHIPADVRTENCATASELKAFEASGKIPRALGHPPAHPTGSIEYNKS